MMSCKIVNRPKYYVFVILRHGGGVLESDDTRHMFRQAEAEEFDALFRDQNAWLASDRNAFTPPGNSVPRQHTGRASPFKETG
jgi:hypothetical protein